MERDKMFINWNPQYCKDVICPKLMYVIPGKNPRRFFLVEIDQCVLKCVWKCKRPQMAKIVLKRAKLEHLTLPEIKTSFKVTVSKTLWYWFRDR